MVVIYWLTYFNPPQMLIVVNTSPNSEIAINFDISLYDQVTSLG